MMRKFLQDCKNILKNTYTPDSYDHITRQHIPYGNQHTMVFYNSYRRNLLTIISTLFGAPNHVRMELNEKITLRKLGRKFVGLQDKKTVGRTWINRGLSPFVAILNLSLALLTQGQNLVKFFTEALPLILASACANLASLSFSAIDLVVELLGKANKALPKHRAALALKIPLAIIAIISGLIMATISLTFYLARYAFEYPVFCVGRAISSPINSVRAAWYYFNPPGLDNGPKTLFQLFYRWTFGFLFASLSILTTAAMYALIFAPLLPFMGVNAALLTAKLAPGFVSFLASVGSKFMLPLLGNIGFNPILAGLATFAGLMITIPGTVANYFIQGIKFIWERTYDLPRKPDTEKSEIDFGAQHRLIADNLRATKQQAEHQHTPESTAITQPRNTNPDQPIELLMSSGNSVFSNDSTADQKPEADNPDEFRLERK